MGAELIAQLLARTEEVVLGVFAALAASGCTSQSQSSLFLAKKILPCSMLTQPHSESSMNHSVRMMHPTVVQTKLTNRRPSTIGCQDEEGDCKDDSKEAAHIGKGFVRCSCGRGVYVDLHPSALQVGDL